MDNFQHEKEKKTIKNSGHYTEQEYIIPFLDGTIKMYLEGDTSQLGRISLSLFYFNPKFTFSSRYESIKNEMLIGGVNCSYNLRDDMIGEHNISMREKVIHQLDKHLSNNPFFEDETLKENLRKSFIHLKHNLKFYNKSIYEVLSSPEIFIYNMKIKPNLVVLTNRIISLKEHFESVTESPPEYSYLLGYDDNGKEILGRNVSNLEYKTLDNNNQIVFIDRRYSEMNRCPPPTILSISYESSKLIEQSEFKLLLENLSKQNN